MKFDVKPRDQIEEEAEARRANYKPWPNGKYEFEIVSAVEGVSKAGNPMIALDMTVFDGVGATKGVKDWIVNTQHDKLLSLFDAVGLGQKYESGSVETHELEGCSGKLALKVVVDEYNGEKRQKNAVSYYVKREVTGYENSSPATLADIDKRDKDAPPF